MLLFLISSLFILSNGVPLQLQPLNNFNATNLIARVSAKNLIAKLADGGSAKNLIAELADADPAKVQEVITLVEAMIGVAQNDLNALTVTSTNANTAYTAAVSTYDAAVVAQTQGVLAAKNIAETLQTAVTTALAAKNNADGAKTGAQSSLDAEKSRLDAEIASLQQVVTILSGLSSSSAFSGTNLVGHWDAMATSSITKDESNNVAVWSDVDQNYDVKASGANRPKLVASAINGFPAIDFTGADVGLSSDIKYSISPADPFTWIMAVQPGDGNGWSNIFTTGDNNWGGLHINRDDYQPVSAATNGVHKWSYGSDIDDTILPTNQLTICTIWFDGTTVKIYWGNVMRREMTVSGWNRSPPIGYVVMGLGMQSNGHDYSGYIGEVLAYDAALDLSTLTNIIDAMTTKWTS